MKQNPEFICFAHRGARAHEPENTLRAFKKAIEQGAEWIELDVYPIEGKLLVIHDIRLERTTNGNGFIWKQRLEYLRSLDAGKNEKIPLLDEVIQLTGKSIGLNIELKWPGTAELVSEFLKLNISQNRVEPDKILVSSFIHQELKIFHELFPEIKTGALTGELPVDLAAFAERLNAYSVHPTIEFINQEFVDDAHRRGLKVFVYTVNHLEEYQWMINLGVDGIFTDSPEKAYLFLNGLIGSKMRE